MITGLGYHLIHSKPSAELIGHLSQLSWDIVLDDIRLHTKQFPDRAENGLGFLRAWKAPLISYLVLNHMCVLDPFPTLNSVLIDSVL